jgi:hypothetical protein
MALFSPRSGLKLLDWYAARAAAAETMLCMTFAFGINKAFVLQIFLPVNFSVTGLDKA